MRSPWHHSFTAALLALTAPALLAGQAAVDPSVAPRAAALERQGERGIATELLGRYLAVAPDDGHAWLQLGRFYLLDVDDWHRRGHIGDPAGTLYLDFAATALDQAVRLQVDSGEIFRGMVEMEQVLLRLEEVGWDLTRAAPPLYDASPLPGYVVELGTNLLNSCPLGGVLLTGSDLETLSAWYVSFAGGRRADLLLLQPALYATDSVYRRRMAEALKADPAATVSEALGGVAGRRPVCLSPLADENAAPFTRWTAFRLVRTSGLAGQTVPDGISVVELLAVEGPLGSAWARDAKDVYRAASRFNPLLCTSLLAQLGDRPRDACGQ